MAEAEVTAPASAPSLAEAAATEVADNNVGSANPNGAGERSAPLMQRPEWVPEKFFKDGVIDYQSLAKSYSELEKSRSGEPKKVEEPKAAEKVEPVTADETFNIPGVLPERVTAYSSEMVKDGKLSDASYAELAKAGYSKTAVDIYVAGLTLPQAVSQAVSEARIADTEIASITDSIGGKQALTEMLAWANTGLSKTDLAAYNEAVSSNDPSKVRMAVNGLHKAFSDEHGSAPRYLGSSPNPVSQSPIAPFANNDEVAAAMATREYKTNPAYRQKVWDRLAVSDVFQQSKDTTKAMRYQG